MCRRIVLRAISSRSAQKNTIFFFRCAGCSDDEYLIRACSSSGSDGCCVSENLNESGHCIPAPSSLVNRSCRGLSDSPPLSGGSEVLVSSICTGREEGGGVN